MLGSPDDSLVLVYHPLKEKNRGLKEKFDHYCRNYDRCFRYNGLNESPIFNTPAKLPAIIFFKSLNEGQYQDGVKEFKEFKEIREHMVVGTSQEAFDQAIDKFIKPAQ